MAISSASGLRALTLGNMSFLLSRARTRSTYVWMHGEEIIAAWAAGSLLPSLLSVLKTRRTHYAGARGNLTVIMTIL